MSAPTLVWIAESLESIAGSLARLAAIETERFGRELAAAEPAAVADDGLSPFERAMGGIRTDGQ